MALFKILRGPSNGLKDLSINDGWCYFTPDTGLFHIDYEEGDKKERIPLNANKLKNSDSNVISELKDSFDESFDKDDEDLKKIIPSVSLLRNHFVKKSGDTMTGNLIVHKDNPAIGLKNTNDNIGALVSSVDHQLRLQVSNVYGDDSNRRYLQLFDSVGKGDIKDALCLVDVANNEPLGYPIFHTGNYSNYALPRDGSVAMTGALDFNPSGDNVRTGKVTKAIIGNSDYGTQLVDYHKEGDFAALVVSSSTKDIALVTQTDNKQSPKQTILHTGNKSLITPADIGALKIYTNITDLGLTEADATAEQIALAMSDNSMLLHAASGTATSSVLGLPVNWGLLRVIKRTSSYVEFDYNSGTQSWSSYYNHGSSSGTKWYGWRKNITSDVKTSDIVPIIIGTQTAATGTWTGTAPTIESLYDGLTIKYYLPYAGSGNATLNLTLADGTKTGAINCYYSGTSRLTTHYGAGSLITLTYYKAGSIKVSGTATTDNRWIADADYSSVSVSQTVTTTNAEYPLLTTVTASKTASGSEGARFASGVTLNPSTKTITATTFNGNAGSATKLATARTIDGVSFNGTAAIIHYGECKTPAATAAKTVDCTGFTLDTGASIKVRFIVTNTAAVANLTLNVNNTGAKSIKYRNANLGSAGYLAANRTYEFVYDGTYYQLVGDLDTNTVSSYIKTGTTTAKGWYRVATSAAGISDCVGLFKIKGSASGAHTTAIISAGTSYGVNDSTYLNVLHSSHYSTKNITKARIVYHTTYSSNYAYLEVYVNTAASTALEVEMLGDIGWTLTTISAGSIPSGYSSKEVTLTNTITSAGDYAIMRKAGDGDYMWYTNTANGAFYATGDNTLAKFGTLPIAQGGTGVTSNPSMLVNLASTSAASVFAASPRPGVTGTLPIANGGTGKTTAPLGLYALINGSSALSATGIATGDYIPVGDVSATTGKKITLANLITAISDKIPRASISTGEYTGNNGDVNLEIPMGGRPAIVFIESYDSNKGYKSDGIYYDKTIIIDGIGMWIVGHGESHSTGSAIDIIDTGIELSGRWFNYADETYYYSAIIL